MDTALYKQRLIRYRRQGTVVRIPGPTDPARARRLGYKAKQGFVVTRVRVAKGTRKRPRFSGGRRPKHFGRYYPLGKSKQVVAEERSSRKYPNLQAVNSYWVGDDSQHTWYEVIMVDSFRPGINVTVKRGRAFRGLTSAGKKSRGLR